MQCGLINEDAHSSKRHELGVKKFFLMLMLVNLLAPPSGDKYLSDLTNMLVRSEKVCMTPLKKGRTPTLLAIL